MKFLNLLFAVLVLALPFSMATLHAEDAAPKKEKGNPADRVRGEITAVSASSITIKTTGADGAADTSTTLAITADTKVSIDRMPATAADLKVGDRVYATKAGENAASINVRRNGGKKGGGDAAKKPEDAAK
jgi:hypothetical protein